MQVTLSNFWAMGHKKRSDSLPLQSKKGFTLIELLMVIAIIGILAALLMPTLSSAKKKADETVDINNFKQIIIATTLYAGNNQDDLPWPNWEIGDSPNRSGWLYTPDANATGPTRFKVNTGVLWKFLHNSRIYFSPLDKTNRALFRQRHQQISSYVMNGAPIGYNRTNYPPAKLSDMQPNDVAFWEPDEGHPTYFNDGANPPNQGIGTLYDQGSVNVTFDGSASYIGIAAWYIEAANTNKNHLWCYPRSMNGR